MTESNRFERAMEVFLTAQEQGIGRAQLLQAHPDLADLLVALHDGDDGAGAEPGVLGDFRLVREVGRGGMGVVWEAQQQSLGRRVALKVLAAQIANPVTIARFRREAQTLARLSHPAIVRVLDVGETAGQWWLAMEFVDGQTLDHRLAAIRAQGGHRGGSLRQLVEIVAAIAEALHHVHAEGILHRDLKPSNVLLRADGQALLSDFGLARDEQAPTVTQVGVIAGTPHYMSPEHMLGAAALTPQSDVFALGTTLYECVTLQRPFDAPTTDLVLQRIVGHDPPDPRWLQPGLARDLAAIVLRAIEKDPARRYASAQAFADDLRAFLDLRPVAARPPSRLLRLRRWARREPLRAVAAGLLAVVAGLGGLLLVQLPAVRAAQLAQRERDYESAITQGDFARQGQDRATCLAAYARAKALFPDRLEPVLWECLAIAHLDGYPAGLRRIEQQFGSDSGDAEIERMRALFLVQTGNPEASAKLIERLGAPATPAGMLLHAACLLSRNRPGDEARASELTSLAVRTSPQPRLFFYACWAGVATPEQRRECAEALLALWPDHATALQQAALCLRDLDPARATKLQQRAVELPGVQGGRKWFFLAGFAKRSGDAAIAVAAAERSFAEDVIPDYLRANLIREVLQVHAPAAAQAQAIAWLQRDPDSVTALSVRAEQLAAAGEHEPAIELLEPAVERAPDDPDLQAQIGRLYLDQGERAAALEAAAVALRGHPDHVAAHELRVAALRESGDPAGVLAEQRRWTTVRPNDPAAWKGLARLLLDAAAGTDREVAAQALAAACRADWLGRGEDREALELRAQVHVVLGEAAAAALCRERAAARPADGSARAGG